MARSMTSNPNMSKLFFRHGFANLQKLLSCRTFSSAASAESKHERTLQELEDLQTFINSKTNGRMLERIIFTDEIFCTYRIPRRSTQIQRVFWVALCMQLPAPLWAMYTPTARNETTTKTTAKRSTSRGSGRHFLPTTSSQYTNILRNLLQPEVQLLLDNDTSWTQSVVPHLIFQHDRAPWHCGHEPLVTLNGMFGPRIIGPALDTREDDEDSSPSSAAVHVPWPTRAQRITPVDQLLQPLLKRALKKHGHRIQSPEQLDMLIARVMSSITKRDVDDVIEQFPVYLEKEIDRFRRRVANEL